MVEKLIEIAKSLPSGLNEMMYFKN